VSDSGRYHCRKEKPYLSHLRALAIFSIFNHVRSHLNRSQIAADIQSQPVKHMAKVEAPVIDSIYSGSNRYLPDWHIRFTRTLSNRNTTPY
jgi:hypothetical protein